MKKQLLLGFIFAIGLVHAETYINFSGILSLPQGGSALRSLGGGAVRVGSYLSDNWAVEGLASVQEDRVGLGGNLLGHWSGLELYDRFFGYSTFDPFVLIGANGWLGERKGQVGPSLGLGAFYHLTDHWSIRADATATLGLDSRREMLYSLTLGIQYTF